MHTNQLTKSLNKRTQLIRLSIKKKRHQMRNKKGQAAIEFLTTYSWAIMGILLTIGALTYFDVFNTNRFIAEKCETGAQISCVEAALTETGAFNIRLANNFPVNITITSISLNNEVTTHTASSIDREFGRGDIETIQFDVGNNGYSTNLRETLDITITFRRSDGTNEYDINGNVVVRPLPAGMIPPP